MTRRKLLPVELPIVPVEDTQNALKCVFSHIFPYVSTPINSTLQTPIKTTPKSSWNIFSTHFLFQLHIFLPNTYQDTFQNNSNMGLDPYTVTPQIFEGHFFFFSFKSSIYFSFTYPKYMKIYCSNIFLQKSCSRPQPDLLLLTASREHRLLVYLKGGGPTTG